MKGSEAHPHVAPKHDGAKKSTIFFYSIIILLCFHTYAFVFETCKEAIPEELYLVFFLTFILVIKAYIMFLLLIEFQFFLFLYNYAYYIVFIKGKYMCRYEIADLALSPK